MTVILDYFKFPVLEITTENIMQLDHAGQLVSNGADSEEVEQALEEEVRSKSANASIYIHLAAIRLEKKRTTSAQAILRKAIKNCSSSAFAKLMLVTTYRIIGDNYYSVSSLCAEVVHDDDSSREERSLAVQLIIMWTLKVFGFIEAKCEFEKYKDRVTPELVPWFSVAELVMEKRDLEFIYKARNHAIDTSVDSLEGQEVFLLIDDWINYKDPLWIAKVIDVVWSTDYSAEGYKAFNMVGDCLTILCGEGFSQSGDIYWAILSLLYSNPRCPSYSSEVGQKLEEIISTYNSVQITRKSLLTRWWTGLPDESLLIEIVEHERSFGTGLIGPDSPLLAVDWKKPRAIIGIRANEILFALNSGCLVDDEVLSIWIMLSEVVLNNKNQNHERIKKGFTLMGIAMPAAKSDTY